MSDHLDPESRVTLVKWLVIFGFALLSAVLQRDMTFWGRAVNVCAGVGVAVVFAEPLRTLLELGPTWGNAFAAVLAMTGRNIAVYILRASKDPAKTLAEFMEIWRGRKN